MEHGETASQAPGTCRRKVQMNLFGVPRFNSQVLFPVTTFSTTYLYSQSEESQHIKMVSLHYPSSRFIMHPETYIFFSRAPLINLPHFGCMHKCSFSLICTLKPRTQGVLRAPYVSPSWMLWHICHNTPRHCIKVKVQQWHVYHGRNQQFSKGT